MSSLQATVMSGRCSFPEDHPLFAGFLPAMRERIVEKLAGHDLVLDGSDNFATRLAVSDACVALTTAVELTA